MPENINLFDINEILKLLRGTYPLPREYRSQFEPQQLNVPTALQAPVCIFKGKIQTLTLSCLTTKYWLT